MYLLCIMPLLRIGTSGTLLVKGDSVSKNVTGMSQGIYSVLEVNPEQTYIYVGGFPDSLESKVTDFDIYVNN